MPKNNTTVKDVLDSYQREHSNQATSCRLVQNSSVLGGRISFFTPASQ